MRRLSSPPLTEPEILRSPRFSVPARLTVTADGEDLEMPGRLVDVSCHGALLQTHAYLPIGAPVTVRFQIRVGHEDREFHIPAKVVRAEHRGTAVEFTAVPADAAAALAEYSITRLFGRG